MRNLKAKHAEKVRDNQLIKRKYALTQISASKEELSPRNSSPFSNNGKK
jgi:hypothetical protein